MNNSDTLGVKLKTILIYFSFLFFVAIGAMTFSLHTYLDRHDEYTAWVNHTDDVLIQASDLLKSVLDLETGVRGYIITGKDEFLEPYDESLKGWDKNLKKLQEKVSDNPSQVEILKDIDRTKKSWRDGVADKLISLRKKNLSKAITLVSNKEGKQKIDEIRKKFKTFIHNELDLKNSRLQSLKASHKKITSIITAGGVTLFLIFLMIIIYLFMSLESGFKTIRTSFTQLESGDTPYIDPSKRHDEFKELFFNFNKMVKENEKYKNQQIKNEKMVAIGRISAGIGHEINNPLTIILGYLKQLKIHASRDNEQLRLIQFIETASFRIRDIVQGLKTFIHKDSTEKTLFSLNEAIESTVNLFKDIYRTDGIALLFNNFDEELIVLGSFGRFQQVLMNLLQNAKDSLEDSLEKKVEIGLFKAGEVAVVTVKDNGEGIQSEALETIFEPFYTTREVGKGSGLGLSLVKEFLKDMNSDIEVTSQVGKGTMFRLIFPLENVSSEDPNADMHREKQGQDKDKYSDISELAVLIVDDEPDIRIIFKEEIARFGFRAETAVSGKQALEMLKRKHYDLVITDYKMPHMTGLELIEKIRLFKNKKDLKIILVSGAINTEKIKVENITAVIKKPIDFDKLGDFLLNLLTSDDKESVASFDKKTNVN